jgi:hypothetical protein
MANRGGDKKYQSAERPNTESWQYSPRRTLSVGDSVRCSPLVGKSYVGKITRILLNESGEVSEIDVFGNPGKRAPAMHTLTPERVEPIPQKRKAQ